MLLIADSGSTKTHWSLVKADGHCTHHYTQGINPFFQTEEEIAELLQTGLLPELVGNEMDEIYFFGAGCVGSNQVNRVWTAFSNVFRCGKIEIDSDLMGAAKALCGDEPGIACILGTGSNSCFYDGVKIAQQVSPLGFIIGDEGSGAVLGKRLVADCLKNQLPEEMKKRFLARFNLTSVQIVENVYRKPFPNRFLASLSVFLKENIEEPAIYRIVYEGFTDFFKRNVFQYDCQSYKVNVAGSVGFYYQDVLLKVAGDMSVRLGKIIQAPMDGLINYYTNR